MTKEAKQFLCNNPELVKQIAVSFASEFRHDTESANSCWELFVKNEKPEPPSQRNLVESIIRKYPKTDDCELQTLGELHEWQIDELKKLFAVIRKQVDDQCGNEYGTLTFIDRILNDESMVFQTTAFEMEEKGAGMFKEKWEQKIDYAFISDEIDKSIRKRHTYPPNATIELETTTNGKIRLKVDSIHAIWINPENTACSKIQVYDSIYYLQDDYDTIVAKLDKIAMNK